jgi:hypothetical protein
MDARNVAY